MTPATSSTAAPAFRAAGTGEDVAASPATAVMTTEARALNPFGVSCGTRPGQEKFAPSEVAASEGAEPERHLFRVSHGVVLR